MLALKLDKKKSPHQLLVDVGIKQSLRAQADL
jgi:hypothetical protein